MRPLVCRLHKTNGMKNYHGDRKNPCRHSLSKCALGWGKRCHTFRLASRFLSSSHGGLHEPPETADGRQAFRDSKLLPTLTKWSSIPTWTRSASGALFTSMGIEPLWMRGQALYANGRSRHTEQAQQMRDLAFRKEESAIMAGLRGRRAREIQSVQRTWSPRLRGKVLFVARMTRNARVGH